MGKSVEVQGTEVSILTRDNKDYISLTDMVKAKDGNFFISAKAGYFFVKHFGIIFQNNCA